MLMMYTKYETFFMSNIIRKIKIIKINHILMCINNIADIVRHVMLAPWFHDFSTEGASSVVAMSSWFI